MKRIFALALAWLMLAMPLVACSGEINEYEALALEQHGSFDYSSYCMTLTLDAFTDEQVTVSVVSTTERQSVLIESDGKCVYYDMGVEKTCVNKDEKGKTITPIETERETRLEDYDFYKYITESERFVRELDYSAGKRTGRSVVGANGVKTVEIEYLFKEHSFLLGGNLVVMFFVKDSDRRLGEIALSTYVEKSAKGHDMINVEYFSSASKLDAKYRTLESVYNKFVAN